MAPGLCEEYGGVGLLTSQHACKVHGSCLETTTMFSIRDELARLPSVSRNIGLFDAVFFPSYCFRAPIKQYHV